MVKLTREEEVALDNATTAKEHWTQQIEYDRMTYDHQVTFHKKMLKVALDDIAHYRELVETRRYNFATHRMLESGSAHSRGSTSPQGNTTTEEMTTARRVDNAIRLLTTKAEGTLTEKEPDVAGT
jgi:hypothetical protein